MNIGILTLWGGVNYGGNLQAYALSETLRQLGHAPKIIRFKYNSQPHVLKKICGSLTMYSMVDLFNLCCNKCHQPHSQRKQPYCREALLAEFDKFRAKHLLESPIIESEELSDYIKNYDAIVIGSDQVWTNLYPENLPYFCSDAEDYEGIIISYAACSSHRYAPFYNRKKIADALRRFRAISVRDETTAFFVRNLTGISPDLVCDPVLLHDFSKMTTAAPLHDAPYILIYCLQGIRHLEQEESFILQLRRQFTNASVIYIDCGQDSPPPPFADYVVSNADPVVWLQLIKNAAFVYTDSFHASIFSLRFHRQFACFYTSSNRISRLKNLADQFDLNTNITPKSAKLHLLAQQDWERIDYLLQSAQQSSIQYLREKLSES